MGRKLGFSFSWKRATGISAAKGRISRKIGVPLTRSGRRRKVGRAAGCFVATVAYGDVNAPEVRLLRDFRDQFLRRRQLGRVFIRVYYRVGPFVARLIERRPVLRRATRRIIRIVTNLIGSHTGLSRGRIHD